ncbi:hypothetical protein [Pedobacter sp. Hv1]|uniref:hypothetical protein n=1 Tax=Pedobacter sp. Hv1 TaxID=1740090 RepID=UPI0006D895EE|nr:hypothetical protein [Pedobacter sp. Hv1]KQC02667.1 hypothetical protein AQF98_03575 [Pedobacter sp. Hv1]
MKTIRNLILLMLPVMAMNALSSCKKDKNGGDSNKSANMKFTITATGIQNAEHFALSFTAAGANQGNVFFKVNGQTQADKPVVDITTAQLSAGPVVVETAMPLDGTIVGLGASAKTGTSFNIKIVPVIEGQARAEINQTITQNDFAQAYTYTK